MVSAKLREMAGPIMWVVIIAFVATIFVSWGMGGIAQKMNTAGSIAKKSVDLASFDKLVQQERQRVSQNYDGSEIPPQQMRMIPGQVWEQQVSQILLKRAINKMKLGATADEIFAHLKNNPPPGIDTASYFMTDGVFDTSKYEQFLNTPASYDNPGMRQMEAYTGQVIVPMTKLESMLKAGVVPTNAAVAQTYREEKSKGILAYAMVRLSAFTVDTNELTDAMISAYYSAHVDSFQSEEQADLYFIKIPKVANSRDEQIYRDEVKQIRDRIVNGNGDFATEARVESDDEGSAEKGGELGWIGRGSMVPEFEAVAFSQATGSVSEPVRTQFGFHLIKVEDKRIVDGKEEVKVSHILRKISPTVETIDSLEALGDSLLSIAHRENLRAAAQGQDGVVFDSTGLFAKGDAVYKVGYVSGMARFAFENKPGTVCENVFQNSADALYLFEVKRRLDKGTMPLEEVRQKVVRKLISEKQREKARLALEKSLNEIGSSGDLASAASIDSVIVSGTTDTISFGQYVAPLGYRNEPLAVALAMPVGERSGIVAMSNGFAVVQPLWKSVIDSVPWGTPDVQMIRNRIENEQQGRVYSQWYLAYRKRVGVVSNIDKYYLD